MQAATLLPGGCTKGELTKPGQQQALDLGAWLRQRYVEQLRFMPAQYEVRQTITQVIADAKCMPQTLELVHKAWSCQHSADMASKDFKRRAYAAQAEGRTVIWMQEGIVVGRTTNYRRTIGTLQGVLTGLYPDTSETVPIATSEEMDEVLFGRSESCARLSGLIKAQARALRGAAAFLPSILSSMMGFWCAGGSCHPPAVR